MGEDDDQGEAGAGEGESTDGSYYVSKGWGYKQRVSTRAWVKARVITYANDERGITGESADLSKE